MSELTDRLRDGVDPPEDSEVADLIDAIDALHRRLDGQCEACADLWPCDTHILIHPEMDGLPEEDDWDDLQKLEARRDDLGE